MMCTYMRNVKREHSSSLARTSSRADARLGVRREAVQLDVRRERVRRVLQVRGGAGAAAVPARAGGCSGRLLDCAPWYLGAFPVVPIKSMTT